MKSVLLATALVTSLAFARGEVYPFTAITANDNSGWAPSVGESQLTMEIFSLSDTEARFIFSNAGPDLSVITSIHFDFDPALSLQLGTIYNSGDVFFSENWTNQKNLPAGTSLENPFTSDLTLSAKNPTPKKGINPYESLTLDINCSDTWDLDEALTSGSLHVGLHVQGFTGGYSESFINKKTDDDTSIPEPGTLSFLLIGLFFIRRFRLV